MRGGKNSPIFSFKQQAEKLLPIALDYGITEEEYWYMTPAELERVVLSRQRVQLREAREKAAADYILADLIGISVGRIYNSKTKFPSIEKIYPNLFEGEEIDEKKQEAKDELSMIRFKQFADSFNKKFKEANDK